MTRARTRRKRAPQHMDTLGEIRRAMRILRRVEKYLTAKERADRQRFRKGSTDTPPRTHVVDYELENLEPLEL